MLSQLRLLFQRLQFLRVSAFQASGPSLTSPTPRSRRFLPDFVYNPRNWVFALYNLQGLILWHFFTKNMGWIYNTAGPSMLPTMSIRGDRVLIQSKYRRGHGVQVGDMVDFQHPILPGARVIKRIIGMPGDFVEVWAPEQRDDKTGEVKVPEWEERMIQVRKTLSNALELHLADVARTSRYLRATAGLKETTNPTPATQECTVQFLWH